MSNNLGNSAIAGMLWKSGEQFLSYFIRFVADIIIARILLPEDYAVIGLAASINKLITPIVVGGLGMGLIYQRKNTDKDYNTVFVYNMAASLFFAIIIILFAPFFSRILNCPRLIWPLRLLTIQILCGSLIVVNNAIMLKELDFKKRSIIDLVMTLSGSTTTVAMCFYLRNEYCYVWGIGVSNIINVILMHKYTKWKPALEFSLENFKKIFKYSSKIFLSNELSVISKNITQILSSHYFNKDILAFYMKGAMFPTQLMVLLDGSINYVMFPVFSKINNNIEELKEYFVKCVSMSMFFTIPALVLLNISSKIWVKVLLTEKWMPIIPYICLISISVGLWGYSGTLTQLMNAMGRSSMTFYWKLIGSAIAITNIFIFVPHGIKVLLIASIVSAYAQMIFFTIYCRKVIKFSILKILASVLKTFLSTGISTAIYFIVLYNIPNFYPILTLIILFIVYAITYLTTCYMIHDSNFIFLWNKVLFFFSTMQKQSINSSSKN